MSLTESERDDYEERAAIIEFDGCLPRPTAEKLALELVLSKRTGGVNNDIRRNELYRYSSGDRIRGKGGRDRPTSTDSQSATIPLPWDKHLIARAHVQSEPDRVERKKEAKCALVESGQYEIDGIGRVFVFDDPRDVMLARLENKKAISARDLDEMKDAVRLVKSSIGGSVFGYNYLR